MKSCLVVDDSKVVREFARRIMEGLSFQVNEAGNGREAIDACKKAMPDVILLDWNMPVMDGLACLTELRTIPHNDKAVVIFCTAENDIPHIQKAIGAGANEYIMKPFNTEILRDKLNQTGLLP